MHNNMLFWTSEKTSPIVEPRPKVLISISEYFEFKMANPENTETCHGIGDGASSPPTILDPLVNIQEGMLAEKNFNATYIIRYFSSNQFWIAVQR